MDDIDLSGAKGVLVNVTAGMDLSISEFEEVGDAVKHFTSDNATVIVGTVIDPNMTDELRVTLVATGLSNGQTGHGGWAAEEKAEPHHVRLARQAGIRKPVMGSMTTSYRAKETVTEDLDYLDIPAFLRRQSD